MVRPGTSGRECIDFLHTASDLRELAEVVSGDLLVVDAQVVLAVQPDEPDDYRLMTHSVIHENGIFKMLVGSQGTVGGHAQYLATSTDGTNWTKHYGVNYSGFEFNGTEALDPNAVLLLLRPA